MIDTGFTRRALHDVRTASQVARARPAYAAGVRAAIASVGPLLLQGFLPPGSASWISLAGLNGALGDRGGPYHMRAATMLVLSIASAVVVLVAALVAKHVVLAAIFTFLIAAACGLTRAWVDVGPGFGVVLLVTFSIALALPPPTMSAAMIRVASVFVGGLWVMLIAIVLWPLRPYRPVRLRISDCYRAIARYSEAASELIARNESLDPVILRPHVVAVRAAIDLARTALAVLRRGRSTETGRGERLLVLHEIADQLFAHLTALVAESDLVIGAGRDEAGRVALQTTLADFAMTMRALASAIPSEIEVARIDVTWSGDVITRHSASLGEITSRMAEYSVTAAAITAALNSGVPVPAQGATIDVADPPPEPVLFSLSAILRPDSVVLHHALRVAIVTTVAVLITGVLGLNHGYWVTLTVVVILQPFAAATRQKALQRVIGTILGAVVAAALSALFHSPVAVLLLVGTFTMLCVALLPLNYGAYAVFGTPAFVLLAESSSGDWHLAAPRIVNTLIGGVLALLGSRLFWPGDEWQRLPDLAAAALRADDELLRRTIELVAGGSNDVGLLRDARRNLASAALNADDSFQRLVSEHRGPPNVLEPIMAFLVYIRRIASSTIALGLADNHGADPSRLREALEPFAHAAHDILTDLADAVPNGRPPKPFPPAGSIELPHADAGPVIQQRVTRIARQLKLLHDSVDRWMNPDAEPTVHTGEFRRHPDTGGSAYGSTSAVG